MTPLPDPEHQPEFYRMVAPKRLLAWVVDTLVILFFCMILLPFTAFTGIFFFPVMMLVIGFAYRIITLANGSATWGMRLFAVELRRANGALFDFNTAFAHTLGYSVSWAMPILQLISVVMMASTERGQGLSDHFLGTVAINRVARF